MQPKLAPIIQVGLVSLTALSLIAIIRQKTKLPKHGKNTFKNSTPNDDNDDHGHLGLSNCNKSQESSKSEDEPEFGDQSYWSEHLPSHIRRERMKEKRRHKKIPLLAMKSQMYDNITMLDPQGQVLSKISRKKARWYVNRGLADFTDDSEEFIKLKFEPKARSNDSDYGKSVKKNICVACGSTEHQMRFYIVPYSYRNLLPPRYKSHISHDIVILCANCHLLCQQETQFRMNEMEEKFRPQKKYSIDHELYKVRSSALALMNWKHKIPEEKVASHELVVRSYYKKIGTDNEGSEELTKEHLQMAIDIHYRIENTAYVPGPELVVNSIIDDDQKLEQFVRDWRRFFLDTIHPRHLPKGWSVDYPVTSKLHGI